MQFNLVNSLGRDATFYLLLTTDLNDVKNLLIEQEDPILNEIVESPHYLKELSKRYIIPIPEDIDDAIIYTKLPLDQRAIIALEKGDTELVNFW